MTTPNLALAELVAAQAQAHVPINTSLRLLDVVVQLSVIDIVDAVEGVSPELTPVDGDRYIVTTGDNANAVAFYQSNAWVYYNPRPGWIAYVESSGEFYYFSEAASPDAWALLSLGGELTPGEWDRSDPYNLFEIYDDCLNAGLWGATGNVVTLTGESGAPGVIQMVTGASSTGEANVIYGVNSGSTAASIAVGGGEIEFEARAKVSAIADGTNSFQVVVGLAGDADNAPNNAIVVRTNATTGVIEFLCRSGGTGTPTADPGGRTLTSTYRTFRIVINAAGTSVDFYVDDDASPAVTLSTNIPSAALAPVASITKSAGATSRTASLDYFRLRQTFTAQRFP